MKGLLQKDLYMAMKYCRVNIILILVFAAGSVIGENMFMLFYPLVMAGVVPISLISYDEKSKWNVYAGVFPYTQRELVSVKYIIAIMFLAFGSIVIAAALMLNMILSGNIDWKSYGILLAVLPTVGLLSPCILLPTVFKLGVEKGRTIYYGVIIIVAALLGILGFMGDNTGLGFAGNISSAGLWLIPLMLLVDIALLALSWETSVRFYGSKEE